MRRSSAQKHKAQFHVYKESVVNYFSVRENWDAVYPYLKGDRFSRRFLEHFITEYARAHPCQYPLTDPETKETYLFNVYHSAQSVLLGVHKRHMDPFSRKNRNADGNGMFEFGHSDKKCTVAVCELIFFRWALKHKVLEYAEENKEAIKADMAKLARVKREKTGKRKEMAIEAVEIELPVSLPPMPNEYWKMSTIERKQQPKKKRKRYRNSAVETVLHDGITIKSSFNK